MRNHPLRPLRHRAVRLIWGASVFSDMGTWVQLVVIGTLVASESGSALQTGLVATATFLPQGLSAPLGGLLADRYDRRRIYIGALTGQGLATGVNAVLLAAGVRTPMVLVLVILLGSCAGSLGAPAYGAMVPDLVPPDELMQMASMGMLSWNSGRIVGPLLGTVLAATIGPAWAIAFNAFTFLVLAGAVYLVRRPFPPDANADVGTVRSRLVAGWRATRVTAGCWHATFVGVMVNMALAPYMGMIPIYTRKVIGGSTTLTGWFSTLQGVGAITGTITVTTVASRRGRSVVYPVMIGLAAVAYLTWALAPNAAVALLGAFCMGFVTAGTFVLVMSMLQRDAPAEQRGRVMSIFQAAIGFAYAIGILIIGSVADAVNLRIGFLVGLAVYLAGSSYLLIRSKRWRAVFDADLVVPPPPSQTADRGATWREHGHRTA